jgi:hypothetical protein
VLAHGDALTRAQQVRTARALGEEDDERTATEATSRTCHDPPSVVVSVRPGRRLVCFFFFWTRLVCSRARTRAGRGHAPRGGRKGGGSAVPWRAHVRVVGYGRAVVVAISAFLEEITSRRTTCWYQVASGLNEYTF